ncbi:MAG: sugar phosphate isomerase/epimerase [Planctomycetota bacterium]|nr:MAG: sugar phosphate isomerase/epimerase [Planctomycetota bacterium]
MNDDKLSRRQLLQAAGPGTLALAAGSSLMGCQRPSGMSRHIGAEGEAKMKVGMNLLLWTESPCFDKHRGIVKQIKDWGYDGVEFPIAPTPTADIKAFAKQCDDLGLGRTVITAFGADQADPASSDPKLREAAVDEIRRMVDKTNLVGANTLVGPLFQGLGRMTGKPPMDEEKKWSAETLRRAGEYGAKHKVRLALEPLNRFEMYVVNTLGDAVKIVRQIGLDNVGLLADTHHGNMEEKDLVRAWSAVAPYIFHVHISENDRGLPGSGHAIPPGIFDVLHRSGYKRWLTIEAFGLDEPSLIPRLHLWRSYGHSQSEVATRGLKFIRDNIAAARARIL